MEWPRLANCFKVSINAKDVVESSPEVGSSSNSKLGRTTNSLATATRFLENGKV